VTKCGTITNWQAFAAAEMDLCLATMRRAGCTKRAWIFTGCQRAPSVRHHRLCLPRPPSIAAQSIPINRKHAGCSVPLALFARPPCAGSRAWLCSPAGTTTSSGPPPARQGLAGSTGPPATDRSHLCDSVARLRTSYNCPAAPPCRHQEATQQAQSHPAGQQFKWLPWRHPRLQRRPPQRRQSTPSWHA
jgi:hypothetical protein